MGVEITRDENDPRYRGVRNSRFKIDKADPAYKHRFVRDNNVEQRLKEGWEMVNTSTKRDERGSSRDVRAPNHSTLDGTIRQGDTVAMRMKQEEFEKRYTKPHRARVEHRAKGIARQFMNQARREGVSPEADIHIEERTYGNDS